VSSVAPAYLGEREPCLSARATWRAVLCAAVFLVLGLSLLPVRLGPRSEVHAFQAARDPADWPFDAHSPWNQPLGSEAVYEREESPGWSVSGGGYANIEWYSIPTYVATTQDPFRRIYDRQGAPFPGNLRGTVRVADDAQPARGTDGHLNIIDETHAWVRELYSVRRLDNGDLSSKGYNRNDLRGMGAGFAGWHGSVAAGTSALGGMIRKGELVRGTAALGTGIRHALQGIILPKALNRNAPGGRSWVWPASSSDSPTGYGTSGNVYMGSLLAIPPWVDIKALGINDPQALEVARALQDYGVYIVDTGAVPSNMLVIKIDPQAGADIRDRDAFLDGLKLALRELLVVVNSHENGGRPATPGGGGTPRRPLAPPFRTSPTARGNGASIVASGVSRFPQQVEAGFVSGLLPLVTAIAALRPIRLLDRSRRQARRRACPRRNTQSGN